MNFAFVLLLVGGTVCLWLERNGRSGRAVDWYAPALVAIAVCLSATQLSTTVQSTGTTTDAAPFAALIATCGLMSLWLMVMAHGGGGHPRPAGSGYGGLLVAAAGLLLVAHAEAWTGMTLGWCLILFGPVANSDRRTGATSAKVTMALTTTALLLAAGVLLTIITRTTEFSLAESRLADFYVPGDIEDIPGTGTRLGVVAIVLLAAGIGVPMRLVPWHFLHGRASANDPVAISGSAAVVALSAGSISLMRSVTGTWTGFELVTSTLLGVAGAGSVLLGGALAMRETRIGPMVGWLAMFQAGLVTTALVAVSHAAALQGPFALTTPSLPILPLSAAVALCSTATLAMGTMFLGFVLAVESGNGNEASDAGDDGFIEDLRGLGQRRPMAALTVIIGLASLSPLPPLPGFWAQITLLTSLLQSHTGAEAAMLMPHPFARVLVLVVIVGQIMLVTTSVRLFGILYWTPPLGRQPGPAQSSRKFAAITGMLGLVLLGVLPLLFAGPQAPWRRPTASVAERSRPVLRRSTNEEQPHAGQPLATP